MCIYSAGHCRKICWVWTSQLVSVGKTVIAPCESRMFYTQPHLGKPFGCWFFFTIINSWCKQASFLKETQLLDLVTSSCNRTPRFIMCCMGMLLMTQRIITTTFIEGSVIPSVHFQCWDASGKYAGCESANFSPPAQTVFSPYKCQNVSLSKSLKKTLCVLIFF